MRHRTLAGVVVVAAAAVAARAEDAHEELPEGAIAPSEWLVLPPPDLPVRRPFGPNAVFARHLLDRDAPAPKEGEEVVGERRVPVRWTRVAAADGVFDPGDGVYAYATVTSDADRVVLAVARGVGTLWVNGEPFVGDLYRYRTDGVPVPLRKGENRVMAAGLRGEVRVVFDPDVDGTVARADATLPDAGSPGGDVAFVVRNPSAEPVEIAVGGRDERVRLLPLGVTKAPCRLERFGEPTTPGATRPAVRARADAGGTPSERVLALPDRGADRPRVRTRVSAIDGSVQEYAVVEPAPSLAEVETRVVLSLHGAGVQAFDQARSYSRRPGFWIVCPTNRRPFGFDWQDWGRLDAYEALEHFSESSGVPSRRVCVTGHSMGGHGAWHLAANDPDRVLAVAPSAGWVSLDTYPAGPRPASALAPLWRGADGASDTLALVANLAKVPAFVVHGTADDNVPLAQAETILGALRAAGARPGHHFEDGAGHWWDGDRAPGADCVDLPAVFEHFERTLPGAPAPDALDWTGADPSVDARHHWVWALRPVRYGEPMRVRAVREPAAGGVRRTVAVETENVARLNVALPGAGVVPWRLVVDGSEFPTQDEAMAWLELSPAGWVAAPARDGWKTPERSGPLKRAFGRRFALVQPTQGTVEETRETVARMRFDVAQWWYRGNGFAEVVLDTEVVEDPARFAERNLVLYGNADTNAAWRSVLGDGPVDVRRGVVQVGDRLYASDAAACFFVRPRADDDASVAAALGDTGPRGCRLAVAHGLFVAGVGYPDYVAWDERTATLGDGGVLAAGWFDASWALDGRGFLSFGGETVESASEPSDPRDSPSTEPTRVRGAIDAPQELELDGLVVQFIGPGADAREVGVTGHRWHKEPGMLEFPAHSPFTVYGLPKGIYDVVLEFQGAATHLARLDDVGVWGATTLPDLEVTVPVSVADVRVTTDGATLWARSVGDPGKFRRVELGDRGVGRVPFVGREVELAVRAPGHAWSFVTARGGDVVLDLEPAVATELRLDLPEGVDRRPDGLDLGVLLEWRAPAEVPRARLTWDSGDDDPRREERVVVALPAAGPLRASLDVPGWYAVWLRAARPGTTRTWRSGDRFVLLQPGQPVAEPLGWSAEEIAEFVRESR